MKRIGWVALALPLGWWIWAQQGSQPAPLARLFPAGSQLYLEARDLSGLLADWNSSGEKRLWLASDNYQVFSRSRLFLKLADAHAEFAAAAGFIADLPMVQSVAGRQSALAIYDVGALEFLYATRIETSAAVNSALFKQRTSYETRSVNGRNYYVRRVAGGRTAAFASVEGLLLLATREDLVANALKLVAAQQEPALTDEPWYATAVRVAQPHGELRMVLNMQRLLESPYFRSYWVQRNSSELKQYSAGLVDLFRESGQLREERTLIRETTTQSSVGSNVAVAQVLAWAPDAVGLRRAWAHPTTDDVVALVRTKITAPGPSTTRDSKSAPQPVSPDVVLGTTADLEVRIDQQPLEIEKKTDELEALATAAQRIGIAAVLHVQRSRPAADGIYIGNETAIAILGNADWPEMALGEALVERRGRALVIASTPELLKEVAGRLSNAGAAGAATYSARYLHARELEPFARMMGYIDASKPRYESEDSPAAPHFFSNNVASFGRVLGRVRSVDVAVHDSGAELKQQIVYGLQ